ncbi:hypothetical protein FE257_001531 [Aspergillus nanangensis]|uniref:Uncharacterized protein n=1 Tax=Aspergillus nanangensis TaxID=2582783 RepID=A0AAD4GYA4_ASPNN|nr:hypothetical protein FE257_001531 [Aspergillus nanangensis]
MSYLSGNAWAIRARERERQLQEGKPVDDIPSLPGSYPLSISTSSGLDYDQELALPMLKPRHLPPSDDELAALSKSHDSKPIVLAKTPKKRSTTDPPRYMGKTEASKGDQEKKKSKIATLRSKLSLKDIGKDFRKDTPPVASMPSLPKKVALAQSGQMTASPDVQSSVKKTTIMYVPGPQDPSVHPSSAPPFQTSKFPEAGLDKHDRAPLTGPLTGSFHLDSNKGDVQTEQSMTPVSGASFYVDSPILGKTEPMHHVHTVILDGSSPLARTGEFLNTGYAQVVSNDQRINSMTALDRPLTPLLPAPAVAPAAATPPYLPSVTTAETVQQAQADKGQKKEFKYPLIVSSDQATKITSPSKPPESNQQNRHAYNPTAATYEPMAFPHGAQVSMQYVGNVPMIHDTYYAAATSHGGYAPPPPHAGYQNTVSLEQYVNTQVDAIHLHLDEALGRLGRAFDNKNKWSSDQVLKNLEKMQRALAEVRFQLGIVQRETLQLEARMLSIFHTEMSMVRADIEALTYRIGTTYNPVPAARPPPPSDIDRKGHCRKKQAIRNGEQSGASEVHIKEEHIKGEHIKENVTYEPVVSNSELTANTFTPMAAAQDDVFGQSQTARVIPNNPARTSSGSPEPKVATRQTSAPSTVAKNTQKPTTACPEDDAKIPHKKGMFRSRFLQTPRRYKQGNTYSKATTEIQKSSIPQSKLVPVSPPILRGQSPSTIHPAMRDTKQQQIMAERERLAQQSVHHMMTDNLFSPSHRHGLRPQVSFPTLASTRPVNMNMPLAMAPYPSRPYGVPPMAYSRSSSEAMSGPNHANAPQLPCFGALSETHTSTNATNYSASGNP